jgi:hypothetical protein
MSVEGIAMRTYISSRWWTLLAIMALAAGLILFETWGASDSVIGRIAPLFLMLYGAIVLWWQVERLVRALKPSMIRVVRRHA